MPDTRFITPPDPLLQALCPLIDDAMLHAIAAADYGDRVDEHYAALRAIRTHCSVPASMPWVPGEVLELIRWSMPDVPTWRPGGQGRRGHLMRAFACAALLSGALSAENRARSLGYADTLIQLLGSIATLDLPLHAPTLALLDKIIADAGLDDFGPVEATLILFAKLWLILQQPQPDRAALAETLATIDRITAEVGLSSPTLSHAGLKADTWRTLAAGLVQTLPASLPANLVHRISAMATLIANAP